VLLLGCSLFGTGRLFDVELEFGLGLVPVKRAGHRHCGGRRDGTKQGSKLGSVWACVMTINESLGRCRSLGLFSPFRRLPVLGEASVVEGFWVCELCLKKQEGSER
jgi:hypothetical protein